MQNPIVPAVIGKKKRPGPQSVKIDNRCVPGLKRLIDGLLISFPHSSDLVVGLRDGGYEETAIEGNVGRRLRRLRECGFPGGFIDDAAGKTNCARSLDGQG